MLGPYIRGQLVLADIGLSMPCGMWLDAVYAVWVTAPEHLAKYNRELVIKSAQLDPEAARETWGALPEHRAMAGQLGRGKGVEAGGAMPQRTRPVRSQHRPL